MPFSGARRSQNVFPILCGVTRFIELESTVSKLNSNARLYR